MEKRLGLLHKQAGVSPYAPSRDFHYANILCNGNKISGILEFELAGIGNKEFDIAWSIILRPGQKFLHTQKELIEFLKGYSSVNIYEQKLVLYYMALIYSRFYNNKDDEYKVYINEWYKKNLNYEKQIN